MDQIFPRPGEGPGLVFAPYDTGRGRDRYLDCYRDAWRIAHGSLAGFDPDACWRGALLRAREDPTSLAAAWLGETFAGVLAMDDRRGAGRGIGWLAFFYIVPDLRGRGCGRALLGYGEDRCRRLGRRALRLTVAPGNPALGFYQKHGFVPVGTEPGALEDLVVMEKTL